MGLVEITIIHFVSWSEVFFAFPRSRSRPSWAFIGGFFPVVRAARFPIAAMRG